MKEAIGILVSSDAHTGQEVPVYLLQAAYLYGVEAYIYPLKEVRNYFDHGFIHAVKWTPAGLKACTTDLPGYTETYYGISCYGNPYEQELKWIENNTVMLDNGGLQKTQLQLYMLQSKLNQYAVPTFVVRTYDELRTRLCMLPDAILKPSHSSGGRGVVRIVTKNGSSTYLDKEGSGLLTEEYFDRIKAQSIKAKVHHFLLEPRLNISTPDGFAADHRCVVSLNGQGEWENVKTFAKIGASDVMSNFTSGGSFCSSESLLEQYVPGQAKSTLEKINRIALEVAELVREKSERPVSFLGIDICVECDRKGIYVIEANSKPGFAIFPTWPLCEVRAKYFRYVLTHPELFPRT